MLVNYLIDSTVYDIDNKIDIEKTVKKLLLNIEKAYIESHLKAPQFPAQKWVDDDNLMPFTQGNHKLPKSTYIINLGCASLCPGRAIGTCSCCSICYAKKAEVQYKEGTLNSRLLQTLRWRKLSAEDIANQLLEASNRAKIHKMKYLRINESGDVFDESDIIKMSKIADILAEHGIGTYTYSSRFDLDWSVKSDNLVVNSSSPYWLCDNQFVAVDNFTDDMEFKCFGDCENCDYCKEAKGITIYVKKH